MKKKVLFISLGILILLISAALFFYKNSLDKGKDFSVNTFIIRMNFPINNEVQMSVKITNLLLNPQDIYLGFESLNNIDKEVVQNLSLDSKETKEVNVKFKDTRGEVATYVGYLVINGMLTQKKIPILLSVDNPANSIVITGKLISQYSNVYPGGKLGVDLSLISLRNPEQRIVKMEYLVEDFDGNVLIKEEENVNLKESVDYSKVIDIPEDFDLGSYVFVAILRDNGNSNIYVDVFDVNGKNDNSPKDNTTIWFFVAILIFILGLTGFFIYFIKTRDEFMLKLKGQQSRELKQNLQILKKYESKLNSLKNKRVKEVKLESFKLKKKKIVTAIKKRQKVQVREIKRLRKRKKVDVIKSRLKKWEKEGYSMPEFNKHADKAMKEQIRIWKKQGLNTAVLAK